ncbi:MAG: DUF349 domain-containing protein [Muribaculaceae bacterium]|nr:DUF349 domain-containing protein [Muribaculaceae bacterium]
MTDSEKKSPVEETSVPQSVAPEADVTAQAEVTVTEETQPAIQEDRAEETPDTAAEKNIHALSKEELVGELRRIVESQEVNSHKEVVAIKQALFALRQREINDELNSFVEAGNNPADFSATPDELENEGKELIATFREIRNRHLEAEEERLKENLNKKKEIIAEMRKIAEDSDNVNQHFLRFQELQKEFRDIKDVTPSGETEIWREFQIVGEAFYDALKINKELRDLDFRKNLEIKRRLIAEAVDLQKEEMIVEASRKLQRLHAEWREVGPVVKELRDSIWEEFKEASAVIHRKHQEFFDNRKEEEERNGEAKTALCEEVEAIDTTSLTTFSAWDEATEKVKEIQAKWRTIGFASRKLNNDIFARFRKACDNFFDNKAKFVAGIKENLQNNYEKKLALCEKAEALLAADDPKGSLDEVIRLQAQWKEIGSVPRKLSDAIWERFTKACREVFDRRKKLANERHNTENSNLQAKRDVIKALKEIPHDIDRREGIKQVKALQKQWTEIGHVPFKYKDKVYAEYREACDALYGAFSAGRDQERRQSFDAQLDTMKGDSRKLRSERERLMRVLEAKQQELKTYNNNLGFFNIKSAQGNSMLKDMERKMKRIEADIREIKEKIALISAEQK